MFKIIGLQLFTMLKAPSLGQFRMAGFALGLIMLWFGLNLHAQAQMGGTGSLTTTYNDDRIVMAINAILTYIEGAFGALIMIAAGLMAIISAAMGQYKASLGLLVVAVGAFILRSLVGTFFNDEGIQG